MRRFLWGTRLLRCQWVLTPGPCHPRRKALHLVTPSLRYQLRRRLAKNQARLRPTAGTDYDRPHRPIYLPSISCTFATSFTSLQHSVFLFLSDISSGLSHPFSTFNMGGHLRMRDAQLFGTRFWSMASALGDRAQRRAFCCTTILLRPFPTSDVFSRDPRLDVVGWPWKALPSEVAIASHFAAADYDLLYLVDQGF